MEREELLFEYLFPQSPDKSTRAIPFYSRHVLIRRFSRDPYLLEG